jgi:hypothetical protein
MRPDRECSRPLIAFFHQYLIGRYGEVIMKEKQAETTKCSPLLENGADLLDTSVIVWTKRLDIVDIWKGVHVCHRCLHAKCRNIIAVRACGRPYLCVRLTHKALSALLIPLRKSRAVILATFAPSRCSRSGARKEPYALGRDPAAPGNNKQETDRLF